MIRILSWNVNGLRAVLEKNFLEVVHTTQADIVCLQETKMQKSQTAHLEHLCGSYSIWNEALERKGYSGTVIWSRAKPVHMTTVTGSPLLDREGRITIMEFETWVLLNIYFPNGGQLTSTDENRLEYKLSFYDELMKYIQKHVWGNGKSAIVVGDFNIVHTERDIARPKENQNSIWFLPIERAKLDEMHSFGLCDIWRHQNPDAQECYSWWSYRAGARPNNVWWRIDAVYADDHLKTKIESVTYLTDTLGSDHCPMLTTLIQEEEIIQTPTTETTLF